MPHTPLFEALSEEMLKDYLSRQQEEHLHLDFKLVRDAGLGSSDDRRNLACAMSGFANSSGGIIVWGVDARKNAEGVDCAVSLNPIKNVGLLISRLNSLTGEGADPFIDGIRHRSIDLAGGHGFAVTVVPESQGGPHMAKLGENRYYKRVGDSFYKMEHYDIADMFGRRRKPHIEAFYKVTGSGGPNLQVRLGLRNSGRATARAPFFSFQNEGTLQRTGYGLDGNHNEGLPMLPVGSVAFRWAYGGSQDFSLHPGMSQEIAMLDLGTAHPRPLPTADLLIEYALACDDQPLERGTMRIPIGELLAGA